MVHSCISCSITAFNVLISRLKGKWFITTFLWCKYFGQNMCEPLFRVILKQQFPIMFTVYIIQSLVATSENFIIYKKKLDASHPSVWIKCIHCNLLKQKESLKGLFKQSVNRAAQASEGLNCWKLLKVENHLNNWSPNISSFCS